MKAVVIGGTGATGRELVLQLLADPRVESVRVFVRRPFFPADPKLLEMVVDFDRLFEYSAAIDGDVAFSTLGTTIKLAGSKDAQWKVDYDYQYDFAKIARANKIFTFVLLSASQSSEDSRFFYSKMKGKLEEAIKGLNFPRLIILKPGFIDRPNTDRKGEKFANKVLHVFNKIGLFKGYRPINTIDLAKVLIDSAFEDGDESVEVYDSKQILSHKDDHNPSSS